MAPRRKAALVWALAATLLHLAYPGAASAPAAAPPAILVVGSLNLDIIVHVDRLPAQDETIMSAKPTADMAVGGKGANQAVAAARLAAGTRPVRFVTRFGNDSHAAMMEAELVANGVDVSGSGRASMPSGQGLVLLQPGGAATSIVLWGANTAFAKESAADLAHLMVGTGAVLLQREVPEHVNEAVAAAAAAAGVPVLLDVGGVDRPLAPSLLKLLDYICPNESELARLTGLPTDTEEQVLAAVAALRSQGARSVLVTLGARGALLVRPDGSVLRQAALEAGAVVDATAAGDAFRAAFAVALVEGRPLQECLRFASSAGGIAVSRMGAVPSLPRRHETERLAFGSSGDSSSSSSSSSPADGPEAEAAAASTAAAAGGSGTCSASGKGGGLPLVECPYQFASRLNSMQARRDLAGRADGSNDVLGWIKRQARVRGLSLVDLNHPQHTTAVGLTPKKLSAALSSAGLAAGAVCLRFPAEEYALGAFSNPDPAVRAKAVQLSVEGCRWAAQLGARDLILWTQFDGYDYAFQADYLAAWQRTVQALRQLADACPPGIRVSLEPKPTDESTRWAIVPSTAAALLLAKDVDRPNFGLTLDMGHMLLAGENPAQSVALVGAAGKLFGLQLNDAHVRLGAEDGLAFASVSGSYALELVRWLQRLSPDIHIFFDTFPKKEDPVREAEHNIRTFKRLWAKAARLAAAGLDGFAATHDAMGALELLAAHEQAAADAAAAAAAAASGAAARTAANVTATA